MESMRVLVTVAMFVAGVGMGWIAREIMDDMMR